MADDQENGLMEETGNHSLNTNSVVVTSSEIAEGESEGVSEDILQQAFVGTEDFEQEAVAYAVQADSDDVSQSVAQQMVNTVVSDSVLGATTQLVAADGDFGTTTYRVVTTLPDGTISLQDDLIAHTVASQSEGTEQIEETEAEVPLIDSEGHQVLEGQQVLLTVDGEGQQFQETVEQHVQDGQEESQQLAGEQSEQQTLRFTIMESSNQTGAPLGSSQNPIRIIQQGNNYTPVQQLTSDQLHQIMQVVQQQQVARNTQEAGGSVLFNPNTNTRIVYRVIYPSELHKGQQTVLHVTPRGTTTTTTAIPVQQAQLPKRQYRRRKDEEEDKMDGPEMSKEEKEERKKHRPRTRSGRVSKPPKHMVKDYKHIHVLDWDEDYDDSDGGYSDYKGSDEEGRARAREKGMGPELYSGLAMSSSRPKNFKCHTCDKSYIGQAGLGRHYRLNPSHGSLPEGAMEEGSLDEKPNGDTASTESTPVLNNGSAATSGTPGVAGLPTVPSSVGSSACGNLSEDSNTQDSIPSSSGAISPITTRTPRRGRGGYRGRGRWAFHHHTAPARRKQKLKELVKTVEDDDLMEVVLPRLVKFVTLWEFMLMKLETCNGAHPRADQIYREYLGLHKRVKQACHEGLQARQEMGQANGLDGQDSRDGDPETLKLEDDAIAKSLGLSAGSFEVKDLPVNEYTSFRYKYLTSDPNGPPGVSAQKRTIQVVTPGELVSQSPSKRSKVTSLLHSSGSAVALAPAAAPASSLLTSIVTNSGLKGPVNKQHSLFRTVAIQQPQTSLLQTVTVQQPHGTLLQNVAVQQPGTMLRTVTVPSQQPTTAVLRTVSMPSQDHSVLRTVTTQPQAQTSLLRSVQQPLIVSPSKQHGQQTVMGVSLLNTSGAAMGQQPSIAVLKAAPGQAAGLVVAASVPSAVTLAGSTFSEIPTSQTAQVVSVLPSSVTASFSTLHHTSGSVTSDITSVAPDDFMDTSCDSLVGSLSGLSSANSSGLVTSINSSLPNGEMSELGFSSVVKVNGVSDSTKPSSVLNQGSIVTSAITTQDNQEQLTISSAIQPENGEMNNLVSAEEVFQLPTTSALFTTANNSITTVSIVNGQVNGSQTAAQVVTDYKRETCDGEDEQQTVLLPLSEGSLKTEIMDHGGALADAGDAPMEEEESGDGGAFTLHQNATLFQTDDGTVILQNPDGTTFQLQGVGGQGLTLESVQELLGQMMAGDQLHTEPQQ
ncbi:hypothetical protein V1264_018567 [Littorina saxatilis]